MRHSQLLGRVRWDHPDIVAFVVWAEAAENRCWGVTRAEHRQEFGSSVARQRAVRQPPGRRPVRFCLTVRLRGLWRRAFPGSRFRCLRGRSVGNRRWCGLELPQLPASLATLAGRARGGIADRSQCCVAWAKPVATRLLVMLAPIAAKLLAGVTGTVQYTGHKRRTESCLAREVYEVHGGVHVIGKPLAGLMLVLVW